MKQGSRDVSTDSDRLAGLPHPRETTALFGHRQAETELLDAYRSRRLPHAWLLGGPEGIGKATLAWRFVRFLLAHADPEADAVAHASDLFVPADSPAAARVAAGAYGDAVVLRREWNDKTGRPFSVIRVEDVRRASTLFQQASRAGGYRVCVLDSAEDLNRESANALLKLIEEPPDLSLFLVVAHRPAHVLPTLRSRCRALNLKGLDTDHCTRALRELGPPWADSSEAELEVAAVRGGGSVRGALRLLDGERLSLDRDVRVLLDRLPSLDWGGLHRLAEGLGNDPDDFEALVAAVLDWLHDRLAKEAGLLSPARPRLAPLAEVWEKVRRSARDAQALNLDKKSFLFSTFAELAQALPPP